MLNNFIVIFSLIFTSFTVLSQNIEELISFESSNPFSLNDIIEDLDTVERISGKGEYEYMKKNLQEKTKGYTITYYPRMLIISKKV